MRRSIPDLAQHLVVVDLDDLAARRFQPQPATPVAVLLPSQPELEPPPLADLIKEIPMAIRRTPVAALATSVMAASLNVTPTGGVETQTVRVRATPPEPQIRTLHGGLGLAQLITITTRRRRARQTHPRKRWRGAVS